jgi:hypothetical protein
MVEWASWEAPLTGFGLGAKKIINKINNNNNNNKLKK